MAKYKIYCDMDGVLADFKTAAVKVNGMSINKWMNIPSSREKWERIKNNSTFWHNLPWMPGGQGLWRYISKYDPHILSAYVEETFKYLMFLIFVTRFSAFNEPMDAIVYGTLVSLGFAQSI